MDKVPERVAIVAMGPSKATYIQLASRAGDRRRVADEVWAINAMAGVIQHDRVFAMDDLAVQEIRAEAERERGGDPEREMPISAAVELLREHPGPVYTSRAYPEYPGTVEFPLADVLTKTKGPVYLNNTVAYAVAYAVYLGVKEIQLYGVDYAYKDGAKVERGRACTEFWMALAAGRGIRLVVASDSSLLDNDRGVHEKVYGFDSQVLHIEQDADGAVVVRKEDRDRLPTAAEMNRRYSHDPNLEKV